MLFPLRPKVKSSRWTSYFCGLLFICVAATVLWRMAKALVFAEPRPVAYLKSWDPVRAADYLDRREVWWQYWPAAQMSHKTTCISCHTVVPYAIVRTSLGRELSETGMPAPQKVLMASVETRVQNWSDMPPFYSDSVYGLGKTAESRATEAVLNAVILASYDAQLGHLRSITRLAFDEAWALQEQTGENVGGWKWQNFHLAPFESVESGYLGAALLMLEIDDAPDGYASQPQIQEHLLRLRSYLRVHFARQPLLDKIYILWLSPKEPGLLTAAERTELLRAIRSQQQPDGGWSLPSLDPQAAKSWLGSLKQRLVEFSNPAASDGYATALVVVALDATETRGNDKTLTGGLHWLESHQERDGSWRTYSLNAQLDPESNVGRFMRDAATAFAVMALEKRPLKSVNTSRCR